MSPTISNVVMDSVICHWVTGVAEMEPSVEGLGMLIQDLVSYFYTNNGIVKSTQLERLQREFDVLSYLFDRVGLHKNTRKTVMMECQPYHMPVRISVVEYERGEMGTVPTYQERQRIQVQCLECGVEVAAGLMLGRCWS